MADLADGWAGIVADGEGWRRVTPWGNRHWEALMDGRDGEEATHVGYFNGADWEDVEPINEPVFVRPTIWQRLGFAKGPFA